MVVLYDAVQSDLCLDQALLDAAIARMSDTPAESESSTPSSPVMDVFSAIVAGVSSCPEEEIGTGAPDFIMVHGHKITVGTQLSKAQFRELEALVQRYSHVFAVDPSSPTPNSILEHTIDTGNALPVARPPFRYSEAQRALIVKELNRMLESGLLERSVSPWASPVLLVAKKDGTYKLAADLRAVNALTRNADSWPIPRMDDAIQRIQGHRYISTLDAAAGFHAVPIAKKDRPKSAIITPLGLLQHTHMCYGLRGAPSSYNRLMYLTLADVFYSHNVAQYFDDIATASDQFSAHMASLEAIFKRLAASNLQLKAAKCVLCASKAPFLGHIVSAQGREIDPDRVSAVRRIRCPHNVPSLRRFLGSVGSLRDFVFNFSHIAAPLEALLSKKCKWQWSDTHQRSFEALRNSLLSAPVFAKLDISRPFVLAVDASGDGIGAVLYQRRGGCGPVAPVAYASRRLTSTERRYDAGDRELVGIVWSLQRFRSLVKCQHVDVFSDHEKLRHFGTVRAESDRHARWLLALADFDYRVHFRPRTHPIMALPDLLSRCEDVDNPETRHFPEGFPAPSQRMEALLASVQIPDKPAPEVLRSLAESQFLSPQLSLAFHQPSLQTFITQQRADPKLAPLIQFLLGRPTGDRKDRARIRKFAHFYRVLEGVLYHTAGKASDRGEWKQLVVPKSLVPTILRLSHSSSSAGHPGRDKTLRLLQRYYYWDGMSKDCKDFVRGCEICQSCKPPQPKRHGLLQRDDAHLNLQPFDVVGVDLCGPFPRTARGNRYILSIVDHFTGWPELVPVPDQLTPTVLQGLWDRLICCHGIPSRLHSDQGPQFVSHLWSALCKKLGVLFTKSSAYHAQSNGAVETVHRPMKTFLRMMVDRNQSNWDLLVPSAELMLRQYPQQGCEYSAFELVYGRSPRLVHDLMFGPTPDSVSVPSHRQFYKDLQATLSEAFDLHRSNKHNLAEARKKRYDALHKPVSFPVGSKAWLWSPAKQQHMATKLLKNWKGPYTVIAKTSPVNYKVRLPPDKVVHVQRLRRHFPCQLQESADLAAQMAPVPAPPAPVVPPAANSLPTDGDFIIIVKEGKWFLGKSLGLSDDLRQLEVWFYNTHSKAKDVRSRAFFPVWWDEAALGGKGAEEFALAPSLPHLPPYTSWEDSQNIITSGFQLSAKHCIPASVLHDISLSPKVDWVLPPRSRARR